MPTKSSQAFAVLLMLSACSASPDINVGNEPDGSIAGSGGASGFGGSAGFGGVGGDNSLAALITEPPSEMAIEVVTISCAGECKQVLAIARGGNDPYTFTWNDGVTSSEREICADDTTTFTVTVTDTAFVADEFNYAGQTATASVTADVLSCPTDGGVDAAVPGDGLCLNNPSLEGLAGVGVTPTGWDVCLGSPDTEPALQTLPPSDGATYLSVAGFAMINGFFINFETAGATLCAPLASGTEVAFSVDLAMAADSIFMSTTPTVLEIWGSMTPCGKDELLWTSAPIANTDAWMTHCGTLRPSAAYPFLLLTPSVATSAFVLVDNFTPGTACAREI